MGRAGDAGEKHRSLNIEAYLSEESEVDELEPDFSWLDLRRGGSLGRQSRSLSEKHRR